MNKSRRRIAAVLLMLFSLVHLMGCEAELMGPRQSVEQTIPGQKLAEFSVPAVTTDSSQPLLDVQQTVYETLFDTTYDPDFWNYSMDAAVDELGVFTGANQHGDVLELEVLSFGAIPLADMNLTPEQFQEATDAGMTFGAAIGWISAGAAKMPVSGTLFAGDHPDLGFQSRFMVTAIEDEQSWIFAGDPADEEDPGPDSTMVLAQGGPITPGGRLDECEQACYDEYNAAVRAAWSAYNDAVDAAQDDFDAAMDTHTTNYNNAVNDAWSTFNDSKDTYDALLAAELTACHLALIDGMAGCAIGAGLLSWFTAGLSLVVCIAAVHAVYAACVAVGIAVHSAAVSGAATARDNAINTAKNTFNIGKNAATAALNEALRTAQEDLQDALDDAQQALDDCLDKCRRKRLQEAQIFEPSGYR